jgi:hypothetical protein
LSIFWHDGQLSPPEPFRQFSAFAIATAAAPSVFADGPWRINA